MQLSSMSQFKILFIAIVSLGMFVACQSTPPQISKGFLRPKDIPPAIADHQKDVLILEVDKVFEIPADEVFQAKMNCMKDPSSYPHCQELDQCTGAKDCQFKKHYLGSGFIDAKTGSLFTAFHLTTGDVDSPISKIQKNLNDGNFRIKDQHGLLLFSTENQADRVVKISDPCPTYRQTPSSREHMQPLKCDAVALQLSRSLKNIEPLTASFEVSQGLPSFGLGYPGRTNWDIAQDRLNSMGEGQYVSTGQVGDIQTLLWENREVLMNLTPEFKEIYAQHGHHATAYLLRSREFQKAFVDDIIAIEGLLNSGMSGGPILNPKGQWIGLMTATMGLKQEMPEKFPYPFSMGISSRYLLDSIQSQH